MTATPATRGPTLEGLTGALADIVLWVTFYLQRAGEPELDPGVAEQLLEVIADALRRLPVADRLTFLEHATTRAHRSEVPEYQDFLLEVAETFGLE